MKALTFVSCLAVVFAALHASAASNADCPAKNGSALFAKNDYPHLRSSGIGKAAVAAQPTKTNGTDGVKGR